MSMDEKSESKAEFRLLTQKEVQRNIGRRKNVKDNVTDSDTEKNKSHYEKRRRTHSGSDDDTSRSSRDIDDGRHDRRYVGRKRYDEGSGSRRRNQFHKNDRRYGNDRNVQSRSSASRDDDDDRRRKTSSSYPDRDDHERYRKHDRSHSDRYRERNRGYMRPPHSYRRSSEDSGNGGDKPAWATRAVVKRAEEINQRKLIWNKAEDKKDDNNDSSKPADNPRRSTTATWSSILAASSSDSKQLDKFKRLMGMKKGESKEEDMSVDVSSDQVEAERKRQLELYSQLDQQYAVARSITHLGRAEHVVIPANPSSSLSTRFVRCDPPMGYSVLSFAAMLHVTFAAVSYVILMITLQQMKAHCDL